MQKRKPRNPENWRKIGPKTTIWETWQNRLDFSSFSSNCLDFWGFLFCSWSTRCQPTWALKWVCRPHMNWGPLFGTMRLAKSHKTYPWESATHTSFGTHFLTNISSITMDVQRTLWNMIWYRSKNTPTQTCEQCSATFSNNSFVFWGVFFMLLLFCNFVCLWGNSFCFLGHSLWCGFRMILKYDTCLLLHHAAPEQDTNN